MNIQEILNFYFSKYEDGTIIYGDCIKRILKNDWENLYIQIRAINKRIDDYVIPKDNIKTFGDTLIGVVVKDQSGNVDIKIVDTNCNIFANHVIENIFNNCDTEEMFNEYELGSNLYVEGIKDLAEDTEISPHFNISLLESYCKNYNIDKNTLVDSKEKEMNNSSIYDTLNEFLKSFYTKGDVVYGEQIRKLLQNKSASYAPPTISFDRVYCGYDVDSLYGVVVQTENGLDVEILGCIRPYLESNKIIDKILTKKGECEHFFLDKKIGDSHYQVYEDLLSEGFNPEKIISKHSGLYDPKSVDEILAHVKNYKPNKSRLISTIYNSYQEKKNSIEPKFNMDAKTDTAIPTPKSMRSFMLDILKTEFNQEPKPEENIEKANQKMSITDRTKKNLEEGAYQGVAKSAVSNVIDLAIAGMAASGMDEKSLEKIKELLKTEIGFSLISMAIGSGVMFIPGDYATNKHVQRLADKCQQNASAAGVEQIISLAVNILKPAIDAAINGSAQVKMLDALEEKSAIKNTEKLRVAADLSDEEVAFIQELRSRKMLDKR